MPPARGPDCSLPADHHRTPLCQPLFHTRQQQLASRRLQLGVSSAKFHILNICGAIAISLQTWPLHSEATGPFSSIQHGQPPTNLRCAKKTASFSAKRQRYVRFSSLQQRSDLIFTEKLRRDIKKEEPGGLRRSARLQGSSRFQKNEDRKAEEAPPSPPAGKLPERIIVCAFTSPPVMSYR